MKPLFSLLFFLLLPRPSQFYSLKNCTADFYDQTVIDCKERYLNSVPSDIPKSATGLSVASNDIVRINRRDFTGFSRLVILYMRENVISQIDDDAFVDLSILTDLDLSINELTNLSDHMFKGLSSLLHLYLEGNHIESISKSAFEPLKSLQEVDLSGNNLAQMSDIVQVLQQVPLLKVLDLRDNQIISFESDELLFPLVNMTNFDVNSESLERYSVHSDVFPRLKSLDFTNIGPEFEWDVPNKTFLKSVTRLDLSKTQITIDTRRLILQSLESIEELHLGGFEKSSDKDLLDSACVIPSLQRLHLNNNEIFILNDTLLQSCTNLTELTLERNSLRALTEHSLRTLTQLTTLTIQDNLLSEVPPAVRNISTLTFLSLQSNQIKQLGCSDFLNLSSMTELNLGYNHITKLSSCAFKDLQSLSRLNVENNFLGQLDDRFGVSLPNLVLFNANKNNIASLQKGTFQNMSSLTDLSLKSVGVTIIKDGALEGLLNLKTLTFSPFSVHDDTFLGLAQLESLVLVVSSSFELHFINLPLLQELTIKKRSLGVFVWTKCPLIGLDNLRVFSSDSLICDTPHPDTFRYTPRLLTLQMINCDEVRPGPELFQPVTDLQVLDLSHNKLRSLDFLVGANLTKLERLNLRNNELSVINESVFEALPSLKYLDLSGNPFACNCSNAGFIEWATTNNRVQVADAFQYRCSAPFSHDGHFLLSFDVRSCWELTGFLCFISTSASVLVTLLSSFIYHFLRWQLAYGYYLFLAFLYDNKKRTQGGPYIYDAFVSYNVHDEEWVYGELLPELEEQQGWGLCLHHRDFQPGKPIIENITDAIYSSRKTLCVISRRYLQSEWCSREIQMASFRLFDEQKDVLILLFLEEIPSNQLSPFYRMRKLVKSRTYLSWTQARSHKGVFWEKVRRALETGNKLATTPTQSLLTFSC